MKVAMKIAMIAGIVVSLAGQANGTSIVPMDLSDLTGLSESVVVATVVEKDMAWDESHSMIRTRYVLAVEESLKKGSARFVTIEAAGGLVDDLKMAVGGIPQFEVGDGLVLFLSASESGMFPVVGWENGVFRTIPSDEKSGRAIFSHDWQPVTGIDSGALEFAIQEHALQEQDGPQDSPTSTGAPISKAKARTGECISLKDFLNEVESIAAHQELAGFSWKYAEMFEAREMSEQISESHKGVSSTGGDPALPQGIQDPETQTDESDSE